MKKIKSILATAILVSIVGCQSTSSSQNDIAAAADPKAEQANALEQYKIVKVKYESWLATLTENTELKIYSKKTYSSMTKAWKEAVDVYEDITEDPSRVNKDYSVFSSGTYIEEFEKQLASVEADYNALLELKVVADEVLSDAQAQMNYLDEIDAKETYPSDYERLNRSYAELYVEIEDGNLNEAQAEQVKFINKAKQLEIKVVLEKFIAPLKSDLSKLKREEFNEVAAISFAKASAEIDAAEQVVKANTRELEIINEAVADAQFELDHVWNIAHEVKLLSSVKNNKFEPRVLEYENKLLAVSKAINGADYRDSSLREQAEFIVKSITDANRKSVSALTTSEEQQNQLKVQNEQLQNQVSEQLKIISQIQAEKSNLAEQLVKNRAKITELEALVESFRAKAITDEANDAKGEVAQKDEASIEKPEQPIEEPVQPQEKKTVVAEPESSEIGAELNKADQ